MNFDIKLAVKYFLIIIVVLGIIGQLGDIQKDASISKTKPSTQKSSPNIEIDNAFYGYKKLIGNQGLEYIEINNFFGGIDLDFRVSSINSKAKLDISNLFGGVKIIVPKNWNVKIVNSSIFGDTKINDDNLAQNASAEPTLTVDGICIFGGIEIERK